MKQKQIYIFYTEANEPEAEQIAKDIKSIDVNCILQGSTATKVAKWKEEANALAILLISDNFLKSLKDARCLELLLKEDTQKNLFVVLADGRRFKKGFPNQLETYPTEIHTLNNVMYYRDYWYEEWINLRKKTKGVTDAKLLANLEENKAIAKKMSVGTISTYIRSINKLKAIDWKELVANNYKELVAKLGGVTAIETKENKKDLVAKKITEKPKEVVKKKKEEKLPSSSPKEEKKQMEEKEEDFKLDLLNSTTASIEEKLEEYEIEEVTDIDILFYIAESNTEEADYKDAKNAYERILALDPYNGRALIWLARLLANQFENEGIGAETYFKKAIMVNDENANLYYEYGLLQQTYFESYYKASDSYREAISIDPYLEEAYFGLAQCLNKLGMIEPAQANYLQACALDTTKFETKENDTTFGIMRAYMEGEEGETATEAIVEEKLKSPNADTVVLVTGASTSTGKAIVQQFAVNGYKVIVTGDEMKKMEAIKSSLLTAFDEIQLHCLSFDAMDLEATQKALDSLPTDWKNIDILVNNAGLVEGVATIQNGNIEHWNSMINTNIKALLYMTRLVSPGMIAEQKGHIINLGAIATTSIYTGGGVYAATKAAVDSLTYAMRLDLQPHQIKVSSINSKRSESKMTADQAKTKGLVASDVADAVYYIVNCPAHINIEDLSLS